MAGDLFKGDPILLARPGRGLAGIEFGGRSFFDRRGGRFDERDPPNVKSKAFERNGSSLGFVLVNAATKVMSLYDPGTGEDHCNMAACGTRASAHQGKTIYARLDKTAIDSLENGKNLTDRS